MKTGRILGIVGGLLAVVGIFLPWATATNPTTNTSSSASGISVPIFGILVALFSVLGLVLVFVGKKGTCTAGAIMGILAFIFAMIFAALWSAIITTFSVGDIFSIGYGLYVTMIGSIILILGSFMARGEAVRSLTPQVAPPPMFQQPTQ